MKKHIKGKVVYQNIEMGFWGITDEEGNDWLPVNFPEQLKKEGAEVNLTIEVLEDEVSFQMWGRPIRILSFHTLNP